MTIAPQSLPSRTSLAKKASEERSPDRYQPRNDVFQYALQWIASSLPLAAIDLLALWGTMAILLSGFRALGFESVALPLATFSSLAWSLPLFLGLVGMYPGAATAPALEIKRSTKGISLLFGGYVVLALSIVGSEPLWLAFIASAWLTSIWTLPAARIVARRVLSHFSWWGQRTLVVGLTPGAERVMGALKSNRSSGLRPVAFLDVSEVTSRGVGFERRVADLARRERTFWAIAVVDPDEPDTLPRHELLGVPNVLVISRTLGETPPTSLPFLGAGLSGVCARDRLLDPMCLLQKRILDLTIATLTGLVLSPLLLLIAAAIKLTSRGPVLFQHERIGRGGRRLGVYKFRTMVPDANERLEACLAKNPELRQEWERTQKLKNDPRVTPIGNFLRRYSLDELPQLWNVLRGEMSLVGPRPIVDDEVHKYGDAFELYKRVTPGVTGLWQVSGRNNTTYERRVDLDAYYVRNWSIWLEMDILIRTTSVVVGGDGAF